MAVSRFRSLFDPELQDQLGKLPSSPATSPTPNLARAQTLARSSKNPEAQYQGQKQLGQIADANYDAQREADRVARENTRIQSANAKEQARTAEEQRARSVREAAAQGVKVETNVTTGKRDIARHEDGAPAYKAGPIGDPKQIGTASTQVTDSKTGVTQLAPASNPLIADDGGVLGAAGGTSQAVFGQTVRDDRGNLSLVEPDSKTDPKTGIQTVSKTDPTTGRSVKTAVGVDQAVQEKARIAADQEARRQENELRGNTLAQQRAQFEPKWKPASQAFDEASKNYEPFNNPEKLKFIQDPTTGKVALRDPATGKPKVGKYGQPEAYNVDELTKWQADQDEARRRFERAKVEHDKMLPFATNLKKAEQDHKNERLKLAEDRIRHEAGLPPDDGGIAAILAQSTGQAEATQEQQALAELSAPSEFVGPPKPVVDTTNPDSVFKAFAGLQAVEGLTTEQRQGFTAINRGNKWIGSIEDAGSGQKVIVLTDAAREEADINKTLALGVTAGAPVYLRDNGQRKDVAKEAENMALAFRTIAEAPDQKTANTLVQELGMDRQSILAKVDNGTMSLQTGEALMKHFYGDTLKPTEVDTPQAFAQWLQETSKKEIASHQSLYGVPTSNTVATRWGNKTNLADKQEVRREYLRDWFTANQGKPGVTREKMQRLYAVDVADSATTGERIGSALKTGGRMIRDDVGGSMLGLAAKFVVGLGAAEIALFGNQDAKKTFTELLTLTNRDTANFAETTTRNVKAWTTEDGQRRANTLEVAVGNLKSTIDAEHSTDKPNKEAIAAAAQQATNAALGLHALSPDAEWPITADSLSPDKDPALGAALARYVATADPKEIDLYKERLLMSNGRRQFSAEIEKKTAGTGKFGGAMVGAMYSGWQEVASEMVADAAVLATGFGSKAIQAGLKGVGAVGKASKLERIGLRIGTALENAEKFGIKAESLVNPLTRGDKAANMGKAVAKSIVIGGGGEGLEGAIVEVGSDQPDFIQAFASEMLGGVGLAPIEFMTHPMARRMEASQVAAQVKTDNVNWTRNYNASMADQPGFVPITPEEAMTARSFVNPEAFKAAVENIQAASGTATDEARFKRDAGIRDLSALTQEGVQAAQEISAIEDPTERAYYTGIAKVATGNEQTLTQPERSAIQGATTPTGSPIFGEVNDSKAGRRTVLTDEARAHLRLEMPAIGSLIRTTASDAIFDQIGKQATTPAPNEQNPQGTPGSQAPAQDSPSAPADPNSPVPDGGNPAGPPVERGTGAPATPEQASVDPFTPVRYAPSAQNQGDAMQNPNDSDSRDADSGGNDASAMRNSEKSGVRDALSPARAKATAAIERVRTARPAIADMIEIDDGPATGESGGAVAYPGKVAINLADLEAELSSYDESTHAERIDAILDEEIVHLAQYEAVKRKGVPVKKFYTDLWNEFTPEQKQAAENTYQANFKGKPEWAKAAEAVRILIQQRANGQVTELTKAFSKNMSARMIEMLKEAVAFLKETATNGKLSKKIEDAIAGIEAILKEFDGTAVVADGTNENVSPPTPANGQSDTQVAAEEKGEEQITDQSQPISETPDPLQDLRDATETIRKGMIAARKAHPELRDTDLGFDLEDIAYDMAEALAGVPADQRKGMVDSAIEAWLEANMETKPAKATGTTDQRAKRKAWRQAAQDKLNATARAILNSGVHEAFSAVFDKGRITPMPNILGLIRKRRADGKVLTQREIDVWKNKSEWDGVTKKSDYMGSGQNPLARAMIDLIMARQGEGQMPNVMADALKRIGTGKLKDMDSASDLWEQLAKELRAVTSGKNEDRSGYNPMDDPNYEPSDAEIAAWEAKQAASVENAPTPQPYATLADVHGFAIETFGADAPVTQKIGILSELANRFNRDAMPLVRAAVAAEFQRVAAGESIVEHSSELSDREAKFQKVIQSHTPESLRAQLESMPVEDAESALYSSPLSSGQDEQRPVGVKYERDPITGIEGIAPGVFQAWNQARGYNQGQGEQLGKSSRSKVSERQEFQVSEAAINRLWALPEHSQGGEAMVFVDAKRGVVYREFVVFSPDDRGPYVLTMQKAPSGNVMFRNARKGTKADLMDRVVIANALPGFRPEEVHGVRDRGEMKSVFLRAPEFATEATLAQVDQWFRDQGLPYIQHETGKVNRSIMLAEINGEKWLVDDLHEKNFRVGPDGKVYATDFSAMRISEVEAKSLFSQKILSDVSDDSLMSSPTGEFSFNQTTDAGDKSQKGFNFDALEPGPNAKFIENTQKAYDNATTDKARENIAEASAKKEGLSRGKVQAVPQGMIDFGMSGSFGTKDQPGLFASPTGESFSQEKADILKTAPRGKDGHPLAPNGERSNLSEDQWAAARTKNFKRQFGDWEELLKAKILRGNTVATVRMGAIQAGTGERASDAAYRWLEENPQPDIQRKGLGSVVFDRKSIEDTLGHGFSGPKLSALTAVRSVIENGAELDSSISFDGKPLMNWVIAAPVEVDGKRHTMFVRIRQNKADPNAGKRFYVHEIILQDSVENEETSPFKTGSDPEVFRGKKSGGTGLYLSLARRALLVNPETVSKIVDENGEPIQSAGLFSSPTNQNFFDFGTTGSFDTKKQLGLNFGAPQQSAVQKIQAWAADAPSQPNLFDIPTNPTNTQSNDIPRSTDLESNRQEPNTGDGGGQGGVSLGRGATGQARRPLDEGGAGSGNTGKGSTMPAGVPAATDGDAGRAGVPRAESTAQGGTAADSGSGGRRGSNDGGLSPERQRPDEPRTNLVLTPESTGTLAPSGARGTQSRVSAGGSQSPLTPEQKGDVEFIESRLIENAQPGVLLTNGTGTGKTFSGLGAIKQALDRGAKHILVLAPSDKVGGDWKATAQEFFDIQDATQLVDTNDNGGTNRLVMATYANFGQNPNLVNRPWDIIVADEAHYLSQNKEGKQTNALDTFRALTWHKDGIYRRAEMLEPEAAAKIVAINKLPPRDRDSPILTAQWEQASRLLAAARERENAKRPTEADRPKAILLSATPFAWHFSLDYAEGYLFKHGPEPESRSYNTPSARDAFYVDNFGYRMRTGKLTQLDAAAATATGILERRFAERLMKEKAMSGRALQVDQDYSRQFILSETKLGEQIDTIIKAIRENPRFQPLSEYIGLGDYLARRYLLEGMKARESVNRIRQHLAMGRKVVVFHDYKKGGAMNPLEAVFNRGNVIQKWNNDTRRAESINLPMLLEELKREIPEYEATKRELDGLLSPLDLFEREFPEAGIFNGSVSKGQRRSIIDAFNKSGGPTNLILVQRASGKEGISLHDRDGKHQRVFIDIGLANRPTDAIQGEGRIYRHGVQSNAIIEYLSTGTDFERQTFAETIAKRSSTAENLAMGERARSLLQSFATGYNEAEASDPSDKQGTGGKEMDRQVEAGSTYKTAVALFYTNQKKTSRNKSSEGSDYFATPEPLGFKMVEWADIQPGEKVLEPSGGHGAIARFFPDSTNRHAIEPSSELASRLALNATDITVHRQKFEDYSITNKFNAVVMNPPFGTAGKLAMEHLIKALIHLRDGGRVVALIPEGSSMEKRFDKWYESPDAASYYVRAEVKMPSVTFSRAGTGVSTRVLIIDKMKAPRGRGRQNLESVRRDLTGAETLQEFFDELEFITVPPRPEVAPATDEEVEAEQAPSPKSIPRPEAENTFSTAEFNHSKTGAPLFVAKIERRLSKDEYSRVTAAAKAFGGYYSSYSKEGAIPGFHFKSAEARDVFIGGASGESPLGSSPTALFSSPSQGQGSFDFGTTGSFGTKSQLGFDFAGNPTPKPEPATPDFRLLPNEDKKEIVKAKTEAKAAEKAAEKAGITDFGEKIGGARKDLAIKSGEAARPKKTNDKPGWFNRYEVNEVIAEVKPSSPLESYMARTSGLPAGETGRFVINDKRKTDWRGNPERATRKTFATREEAEAFVPIIEVLRNHRVRKGEDMMFGIWRTVTDRKIVQVVKQTFETREEAELFMAKNASDIIETKTSWREELIVKPETVVRKGPDRRAGPATSAMFQDTFGFRGVEFGKWMRQVGDGKERQEVLNYAYDGLLDLAELIGVPPAAISLNGELGLAFGARGQGLSGAKAHYEPDYVVINLTKMSGAGSLAHEWIHALDHYLGRQDGRASSQLVKNKDGDMVLKPGDFENNAVSTRFSKDSNVREEVRNTFVRLMDTIMTKSVEYVEDSNNAERFVATSRKALEDHLASMRKDYTREPDPRWEKRRKIATTAQLEVFDAIADRLINGQDLAIDWRSIEGTKAKYGTSRWTSDTLEQLGELHKAITNRAGFDKERNGTIDNLRGYMTRYAERIKLLESATASETKVKKVPTDFSMNAKRIDQGSASDYWNVPHEMLARGFSAYVEDRIAATGGTSDFLSYGSDNRLAKYRMFNVKPFPEGAERVAINERFDTLFSTLQTKETEKGTALFSSATPVDAATVQDYLESGGAPTSAAKIESERVSAALAPSGPDRLAEDGSAYSQSDFFTPEQSTAPSQGEQIADAGARAVARAKARTGRDAVSQDLISGLQGNWEALAREVNARGKASVILADLVNREIPTWNVNGTILDTPQAVHAVMLPIRSPYFESLKVMVLDGNLKTVHSQIMTVGTLNEASINIAEILGTLARLREIHGKKYTNIILSHNHPSGEPSPSRADEMVTRRLNEAADIAGWTVLDHIITNGQSYYSFREGGLMGADRVSEKPYAPRKKDGVVVPAIKPEERQASWEAVKLGKMTAFDETGIITDAAKALRNGNPDAAHIFYVSTRLKLLAVERVDLSVLQDKRKLAQTIIAGRGREGAYGFILDYPRGKIQSNQLARSAGEVARMLQMTFVDAVSINLGGIGYESAREMGLVQEEPAQIRSSPSQPDLSIAATSPDAKEKLGQVKVGKMNALGAYRTLTAKRDAGKTLTGNEEEQLLQAETALGQKMAFDMEGVKGDAPAITQSADARALAMMNRKGFTKADDVIRKQIEARLKKAGADDDLIYEITVGKFLDTPTAPAPTTPRPEFGQNRRDMQDEMSRRGEIDSRGQISLLSSPSNPSFEYEEIARHLTARKVSDAEGWSRLAMGERRAQADQRNSLGRTGRRLSDAGFAAAAADGLAAPLLSDSFDPTSLKALGSGAEADVYAIPDGNVLRIFEFNQSDGGQRLTYEPQRGGFSNRKGSVEDFLDRAWLANSLPGFRPIEILGVMPDESVVTRSPDLFREATQQERISWLLRQPYKIIGDINDSTDRIVMAVSVEGEKWLINDLHEENFRINNAGEVMVSDFTAMSLDLSLESRIFGQAILPESSNDALLSSPSPDTIDWKKYPPVFRDVYADVLEGRGLAEIAKRNGIKERAVTNIMNRIGVRAQALDEAASGTLTPKTKDGLLERGRPERAMSVSSPEVARILQIREDAKDPETIANAETYEKAKRMIANDYQGTIDQIVNRRANGEDLTLDEVAAAQMILLGKVGKKRSAMTTEEKVQLGWLAMDWVEQGTDDARRLQIRRDVTHSPAERAALYFAKELYTPQDKATVDSLKNAKGKKAKEEVMKRFLERSEGLKARLKEKGIDLEASLEEFRRQQDEKQAMAEAVKEAHDRLTGAFQSEVEGLQAELAKANEAAAAAQAAGTASEAQIAKMSEEVNAMAEKLKKARAELSKVRMLEPGVVLRTAMLDLTEAEKAAMETVINGGTYENALAVGNLTEKQFDRLYTDFDATMKKAQREAARLAKERMLETPPVLMSSASEIAINRSLGIVPLSELKARKAQITPEQVKVEPKKQPKVEAPAPVVFTPEQQAAIDAAFERFKNADPATWSTLFETEAKNLTPLIGQVGFEEFKGRTLQPWRDRWQTEMDGIANPSARMTFDEWIAKPSTQETARRERTLFPEPINETTGQRSNDLNNRDRLLPLRPELINETTGTFDTTATNREQSLFPQPINETTGTWNDTRPYNGQGKLIREEINETTGLLDFNDPQSVRDALREISTGRSSAIDRLMEYWRASILSGPQTAIVNTVSNLALGGFNLGPRRLVEAGVNSALKLAGLGSNDSADFGEFTAMAKQLRAAAKLAGIKMLQSWREESANFKAYALATENQLNFGGKDWEAFEPALPGKLGTFMRSISFRHMQAADEFMKFFFGQMEVAAQAHRIAKAEGLKGNDYQARLDDLVERKGSEAWLKTYEVMQRQTFQEKMVPLGQTTSAIRLFDTMAIKAKELRRTPYLGRPITFFLPFIDTPTNIAKQAVDISPLGGVLALIDGSRALKRRLSAGKFNSDGMKISKEEAILAAKELYDKERFIKDLTNQAIAWGLYFTISGLVGGDDDEELPFITGTMSYTLTKRGERDVADRVMPPQSIRLPGTNNYVSYGRIDPFATVMAALVDTTKSINKEGGFNSKVATDFMVHTKNAMKDKTFLQGVSNLINALEDPSRVMERLSSGIITGFIPNLVRQPIREMDGMKRDVNPREDDGLAMSIAKRIGYSIVPQSAPLKISIWGQPLPAYNGESIGGHPVANALVRSLDPMNLTLGAKVDPLDLYIFTWNNEAQDSDKIGITPIEDYVTANVAGKSTKLPLTPAEQEQANVRVGQAAREYLTKLNLDYRNPTKERADEIVDTFRTLQRAERERLRAEKLSAPKP